MKWRGKGKAIAGIILLAIKTVKTLVGAKHKRIHRRMRMVRKHRKLA